MRSSVSSNESQSPVLRFAITVILFAALISFAGFYFNDVSDQTELTEAQTAIQGYAASLINIHKNWIFQGRPDKVLIKGLTAKGEPGPTWIFLMNKAGWPINVIDGNEKPDCKALWYALQKSDRLAFSGVAIKMQQNAIGNLSPIKFNPDLTQAKKAGIWVCQNIVANILQFHYRLDTGKVEIEQK